MNTSTSQLLRYLSELPPGRAVSHREYLLREFGEEAVAESESEGWVLKHATPSLGHREHDSRIIEQLSITSAGRDALTPHPASVTATDGPRDRVRWYIVAAVLLAFASAIAGVLVLLLNAG